MLQEYGTLPNLKLVERQRLPPSSAIYFAIASEQVLYVGQARDLVDRWRSHHRCPQLEAINRRAMSFVDRWELAKNSTIGRRLFPLECGAHFIKVSGVDTLCLQEEQLRELLLQDSHLQQQYPTIQAIDSDPVPTLGF